MSAAVETARDEFFVASKADFLARARADGWNFWRGMVVGFLAGFPLTYIAVNGEFLPGIL